MRLPVLTSILALTISGLTMAADEALFERGPQAILATKCGGCHGANRNKLKAELDLRSVESILRGGDSGSALVPGKPDESLLWKKIADREMPPAGSEPLGEGEQATLRAWIVAGAKFTPPDQSSDKASPAESDFWSFRPLSRPALPPLGDADPTILPIDRFILSRLQERKLSFASDANPRQLVRRLYLDLIGLPPSPQQVDEFLKAAVRPDAYAELVDQLLATPQYGERWGRQWLDVVGYADSNGYIRHDTLRPLAWRYRDYVIQSLNQDKPYDQFWLEQLAGDELVNYPTAEQLSAEDVSRLVATHYLRNAPDGTDNTEGNEITRVMERYAVLESQLQITMSAMFGMTIECARCHSHKFDPIPQRDYYAMQAIFYPAFNVKQWTPPNDRWIHAAGLSELKAWRETNVQIDRDISALRAEFASWVREHRPPGVIIDQDDFSAASLHLKWSDSAPGDDTPAGYPGITLDSQTAPAAHIRNGALSILAAPPGESIWLVTKTSFDWTPDRIGEWIEVTFDLVDLHNGNGKAAERIGYYIALHDYDDSRDPANGNAPRGNILLDGNPAGGAVVNVDYPGMDQQSAGVVGTTGYSAGHNFGVRVTCVDGDQYLLEHLVDGQPETPAIHLTAEQLPDGGFGFELCCSRSFVVDNVIVRRSPDAKTDPAVSREDALAVTETAERQRKLAEAIAAAERLRISEPEHIAWATDFSAEPPVVPLLKRGDYTQHGPAIDAGPLSVLVEPDNFMPVEPPAPGATTTGRRLAFARWATRPGSRAAALLARVEADRLWRGHFGRGLVPTPENFGASGMRPTHPELLEWLATQLLDDDWRLKSLHRQIVMSRTYRQNSEASDQALEGDPENLLYSRFPAHRLEAEAIRDCMLAAAGALNLKAGGPAIGTIDLGNRQITLPVPEGPAPHEVNRRSIYIQHRRSQPLTLLQVFDQPAPEPNCVGRATATVVAQSLALLNSEFAVLLGRDFAARIEREASSQSDDRIRLAFRVAFAREPNEAELARCAEFLQKQSRLRGEAAPQDAEGLALADFCRMLLATNEFTQVQ